MNWQRAMFLWILCLAFVCTSSADDKDKKKFALQKIPDQWAEISRVADVEAEQRCTNWAWAAGLETTLRRQNVENLDQRFWVLKLYGGLPCVNALATAEDLKRKIDGEYMAGTRKVTLELRYTAALPNTTDGILMPLAMGRPYMVRWKDRFYIVKGATWDEYIFQTGQKMLEIKTLDLIDPLAEANKRHVKFDRERDSIADLGGVFDLIVHERDEPKSPMHRY